MTESTCVEPTFSLEIPALHPGTVGWEVAEHSLRELQRGYARTIERAQRHGTRVDIEAAERAFGRVHERVYAAALIRMRKRLSLRPMRSSPRRPRCQGRRPRPRSRRRRGGGRGSGRGSGSSDGDSGRGGDVDANERRS